MNTPTETRTTRAAHHGRPPAINSAAAAPTAADQLRSLHRALIAYGFRLDYEVDSGKLAPATAQIERHRARHGLLTLARLAHRRGVDLSSALPPGWLEAATAAALATEPDTTTEPTHRTP